MVLDPAVAIAGHVDLDGYLFGGSASVFLEPKSPHDRSQVFGANGLVWNGASFQSEAVAGASDGQGIFVLGGLVPGRYALRLGIDRASWTEMDPVIDVFAPASGLELRPPLVLVTWEFELERRPLADHAFSVSAHALGGQRVDLRTDAFGRANGWLLEGEPYVLGVPMIAASGTEHAWTYGRTVPWHRTAVVERIAMGAR